MAKTPEKDTSVSAAVHALSAEGLSAKEIAKMMKLDEAQVSALVQELIDEWEGELLEIKDSSNEDDV